MLRHGDASNGNSFCGRAVQRVNRRRRQPRRAPRVQPSTISPVPGGVPRIGRDGARLGFSTVPVHTTDSYRGVLAIRDVSALIAASAASQLGDWLYNAALLGYVYSATGSPGWVGAATIFRLLPYALLGPVGGAVADRYDRRTVLLVGDLLRCAQMFALAAVVAFDGPVALVIALTALASAAGTAERPAAMALLPRLVGEARLGPANALLHTVQDLGIVAGPALGAVLLAVTTATAAFVVNGLTFAISAVLISTMRRNIMPVDVREGDGAVAQIAHGLRVGARDSVRRAALPRRGHGGVHLRCPDRAAGRVRRARPRSRRGWVRRAARRGRSWWSAERDRQRTARGKQSGLAHRRYRRGDRVRHAVRVRRRRRPRRGARGDRGGRRGSGGLRGGRRDRAGTCRPRRRLGARHGGLRLRCPWQQWWRAQCSRPC